MGIRSSALGLTGAAALAGLLTGCGTGAAGISAVRTTATAAAQISGNVHGGQQVVAGASIQLYAVNTTARGGVAATLISAPPLSDGNGNFSITNLYNCGTATQVYLVASGGNSGSGVNNAMTLMAALGPCNLLSKATFVQINEVTTVAAAYALAPFATDYQHVGSASGVGIANAFLTAGNLANNSVGLSPGGAVPAGATVPAAEINTLADILATCVNSGGSASAGCAPLFAATGATETASAALAIAKNPGAAAVVALYGQVTAGAPFQPTLTTAPKDFSVAVKYTGGGLATPYGVAVDATGSVWAANESGNSVTKLSAVGAVQGTFTAGGMLLGPRAVAIDRAGNAWVANTGSNNVFELTAAGVSAAGSPFTAGGINAPASLAIDSGGQVWISNANGNSISSLSSAGAATNGSPLTGGGSIVNPAGLALDTAGNVWVSSTGPATVAKFTNAGVLQSGSGYTDQNLLHPQGIALDASGNAYVAANTIGGVSVFTNNGTAAVNSPVTGLNTTTAVAVDGAGTVWAANGFAGGSITGVAGGSAGASLGVLNVPVALAIDASGNVWTANSGDNSLSQFVGLAVPVVTPLAATVGP